MKLTNYQIDAIVGKLNRKHDEKIKAAKDAIIKKETPAALSKAKKVHLEIMKLSDDAFLVAQKSSYADPERPKLENVQKYFIKQINTSSVDEKFYNKGVEDTVVVASISAENIKDLGKKLGIDLG